MMNKYIRIVMKETKAGGGVISTLASFKLNNVTAPFENVDVKIDTGCSLSTIPLAKFKAKLLCNMLKHNDIQKGVNWVTSYGVETGGEKHDMPVTYDEKMCCTALKFKHGISNFVIGGIDISTENIYVSYDRKSNILIGMDILKEWDIHIGKSFVPKERGKTVFIACPYGMLNDDYFKELDRTFLIATSASVVKFSK
ncbi:MAG: hypothetical protein NC400_02765 [Clostridium sp.]|nr:hypothetical protein [Clostridium sp.]